MGEHAAGKELQRNYKFSGEFQVQSCETLLLSEALLNIVDILNCTEQDSFYL